MKKTFIILFFFVGVLNSQVTANFDPSKSKDVSFYQLFWGLEEYSKQNNIIVDKMTLTIVIPDYYFIEGTIYHFFMIAIDGSGNKSAPTPSESLVYKIVTDVSGDFEKKVSFVYPTILNSILFIEKGVKIEIIDILGHTVGIFENQWHASGYASGTYFACEIVQGDYGRLERFVLIK